MQRIDVQLTRREEFPGYLAIKSERANVRWSGLGSPPSRDELSRWFADQLVNPNRIMFTAFVAGEQAGYVHFRRTAADAVETSQGVSSAFLRRAAGLRPGQARGGYGRAFRLRAIVELNRLAPEVRWIRSWVSRMNGPMNKCVSASGFTLTGEAKEQEYLLPERHIEVMRLWVLDVRAASVIVEGV